MSKVKAIAIAGIELFWSNDHDPPHFHARRPGEWSVDVYFLSAEPDLFRNLRPSAARMPRTIQRAIESEVEQHRAELLHEWESIHRGGER